MQVPVRHRMLIIIAIVVGIVVAGGVIGSGQMRSRFASFSPLGGTSVTERDLSPAQQRQLLNTYAPLPVPASASDIRIRYQRFQDWQFEGSFALPPADFAAYVGGLQPSPAGAGQYAGKQIGAYTGSVEADAATGRVTVRHSSA